MILTARAAIELQYFHEVSHARSNLVVCRIDYFAKVKQNKYPVPFELTASSDRHAVFENTDHDFPKKLEYGQSPDGMPRVVVSDGRDRSFALDFRREDKVEK